MKKPKVTLAFISYNRLHYLRATLESARTCIDYPNLEWIVLDGDSTEPGLQDYLQSCDWLDHCIVRECTHADAMNQAVEMAQGEYILIWPEDVQFVAKGTWLKDVIALMEKNPWIGSVALDGQRKTTIERILRPGLWKHRWQLWEEWKRYKFKFRRHRTLTSPEGVTLKTAGWTVQGVVGSGIPSLTRTSLWRELGPWRTGKASGPALVDSSLGAEDDMVARFFESGIPAQHALMMKPVASDIITDPTGTKAKVRNGKRYGEYWPPKDGNFYYQLLDWHSLPEESGQGLPLDFNAVTRPLGFEIPLDENGERLKNSINIQTSSPV